MAPQQSRPEGSRVVDLEWQLAQYASHHNNAVNIGIHLTCIPMIVWSAMVFAAKTGPLLTAPASSTLLKSIFATLQPNLAGILMTLYCAYYIKLDKFAGLVATPFFLGAAKHATHFLATNPNATKVATLVQIFAWSAQFIGHGVYEKRAPKLLDNLLQAFGSRPKMRAALNKLVEEDIKAFRAKKAAEAVKKDLKY
ncbi:hypothetical protein CPC16_007500 [Podila verticillata]|nr:hypothetical protein CPC16_007500 [Podila verticillata]